MQVFPMNQRLMGILLCVALAAPPVLGACYKLVDRVGYGGPGVEDSPCTAFLATGCQTYAQCPAGSRCKQVWRGWKPCTFATATVLKLQFSNGQTSENDLCCLNGIPLPPIPGQTCVVPNDSKPPITSGCIITIDLLKYKGCRIYVQKLNNMLLCSLHPFVLCC